MSDNEHWQDQRSLAQAPQQRQVVLKFFQVETSSESLRVLPSHGDGAAHCRQAGRPVPLVAGHRLGCHGCHHDDGLPKLKLISGTH